MPSKNITSKTILRFVLPKLWERKSIHFHAEEYTLDPVIVSLPWQCTTMKLGVFSEGALKKGWTCFVEFKYHLFPESLTLPLRTNVCMIGSCRRLKRSIQPLRISIDMTCYWWLRARCLTSDHTGRWLHSPPYGEWLCQWPDSQLWKPAVCTTPAQTGTVHTPRHTDTEEIEQQPC